MTRSFFAWPTFSASVFMLNAFASTAFAQDEFQRLTVTDAHRYFASQAKSGAAHVLPTSDPKRRAAAISLNAAQIAGGTAAASAAPDAARARFPGDLQFQGGPTLSSTVFHAVFVNTSSACPPNSCWGDPVGFLKDLFKSEFIHITDQYTGTNGRYTAGDNFVTSYPVTPGVPLADSDMQAIAYAAASTAGSGYGHVVHIFLPPGQDECLFPGVCFSPDNPNTFYFCAYHHHFDSNIGEIVYSVEPWTDVPGCQVEPGTPNGQLADTTNFGLGHETFESITDPDGTAWRIILSESLHGQEVGDECVFFAPGQTGSDFYWYVDPSLVRLHGKLYAVNPIYSNLAHACATGRDD